MSKYKVVKTVLTKNKDGTPVRKYSNMDPPEDRPNYASLQINEDYQGYKGIVYTPIDLPKLEVDMDQVFELINDPLLEQVYPGTTFGCHHGAGKVLFLKENKFREPHGDGQWFEWVEEEMPHVKDFIDRLPYKTIRQLSFVAPPNATPAHYDEPYWGNEFMPKQSPSCYRIRWSKVTNPEEEVFFMTKDSGETKYYPYLPPETNTFVYDGSVWEHGADKGFAINDRCQIIISGVLDIKKHQFLLDKSILKYSDCVLYNEDHT